MKIKTNKYGWLGLISALGLIGVFSDSTEFLGFFVFVYFFRYFRVISDEMFVENIRKAAAWAFFIGNVITILIVLAYEILHLDMAINSITMGSSTGWCISVITFVAATAILEWKESRSVDK